MKEIPYFSIFSRVLASLHRNNKQHRLAHSHKMYSDILFHNFWHRAKKCSHAKCELSMRSIFCDYLNSDDARVRGGLESHNGLFCSFALMILQKNENHEMKWAARIILISIVIYKFYRINFLFAFVPLLPHPHSLSSQLNWPLNFVETMKSAAIRVASE